MKKVKMNTSIASADWSFYPGQEIIIGDELAQAWDECGHCKIIEDVPEASQDQDQDQDQEQDQDQDQEQDQEQELGQGQEESQDQEEGDSNESKDDSATGTGTVAIDGSKASSKNRRR